MSSGTLIRQGIYQKGMTLREAAGQILYSEETMYAVVKGRRRVPKDARPALSRISPLAALAIAEEDTGYVIPVTFLDRIDRHIQTMIPAVIEENEEVNQLLPVLQKRLRNKAGPKDLDEADVETRDSTVNHMCDSIVGQVNTLLELERYGADIPEATARHLQKLIERGYKSPPGKEKPPKRAAK